MDSQCFFRIFNTGNFALIFRTQKSVETLAVYFLGPSLYHSNLTKSLLDSTGSQYTSGDWVIVEGMIS